MHAMKDLALSEDDKIDYDVPVAPKPPEYPWGTRLSFDNSTIKKLGIDPTQMTVGGVLVMHCIVKITNVGCDEREGPDGKPVEDYRIEAQIEQAAIDGTEKEEAPRRALRLAYKDSAA